ncbi:MAG: ribokinase [Cyclobacteriaceae bacterium]|nr:ribokinase [Cyclobacteriaceae bacterium]
MSKILVVGSSNTDLITNVDRFPSSGETITGKSFMQAMGGKGANQAIAARRLGGDVGFVTCLGNDSNGRNALKYYTEEGVDVSFSRIVEDAPTGTAIILVNKEGENCIVVTPGANHELTPEYIQQIESEIASASIVMLQMEIPYETVRKVCELAKKHGTEILLNVAPAREIDTSLLGMVDILVVNETEIEMISKQSISKAGEEEIIDTLLSRGASTVILTLGRKGCIVRNKNMSQFIPAFHVTALDTTAAGDTFCGALVAELSKGKNIVEAIRFATAASAICVTRMGAQPSIPTEDEVKMFLSARIKFSGKDGIKTNNRPII